ncbi:MAG: hypothetical protein WCK17_00535 [Verrucomicrobiota bacterium]
MAGIQHDTLSDIQEIRRLLDGYSEGFAFIKELIQNAEDAEASEIHLVWHRGMAGRAKHPLLQGPALLVLNDGPFEQKHRDGLMRMGLGSKAAEEDRIGRFGLGMKAVFHVCEGFFFFEHSGGSELMEFFSPWHPKHHADWELEKSSADWRHLQGEVTAITDPKWTQWFAVWIPLRSKEHCDAIDPIRSGVDSFPGEEKTKCPVALRLPFAETSPRLGETLIFLKRTKRVVFKDGEAEISVKHDTEQKQLSHGARYYRHDALTCPDIAAKWQNKAAWPKVFRVGDRLSSKQVPDKARWEASVAISVNRDELGSGTLRLFWCVFLPVGDKPYEEIVVPGLLADIHIFLHGYFFLNDSRTHVFGVEDAFSGVDEDHQIGIRIAWNKALATSDDGLLPLVIPALEDCFAGEDFDDQTIHQIVNALVNCKWLGTHRANVAKKCLYGRFLRNGRWAWCSLPVETRVLPMPLCGFTVEVVEATLVQLLPKTGELTFTLKGSPALSGRKEETSWKDGDLDALCRLVTRDGYTFDDSSRGYLRGLLWDDGIPTSTSTAWKDLPIYDIRKIGENSQRLITANAIIKLLTDGRLFLRSDTPIFQANLAKACPSLEIWFMSGGGPPETTIPNLDNTYAADLIIKEKTLGIASDRLPMLKSLTNSGLLAAMGTAARYLLHACWVQAEDSSTTLLFKGGDWEAHVRPLLDALGRSWCWVDPLFQGELNEHQMEQLDIHPCGADDFRCLCNDSEIGVLLPNLQLHESHDFLLKYLSAGETDDELLRRLPIHSLGDDLHTAVVEGVWLAPEENPITRNTKSWKQLRSHAKIVGYCDDGFLALRQKQVFSSRMLDRDGIIRLAAEQPVPTNYALQILECLAQRTPSREAANALKTSKWLPLRDGRACKLEQVIWIKEAEEELDRVTRQLPAESNFFTRSDLAINWEPEGKEDGWRMGAWGTIANPANPLIPSKGRLVDLLRDAVAATPSVHLGIEKSSPQEIEVWLEAVDGIEADFSKSAYVIRRLFTAGTPESPQVPEWIGELGRLFFRPWTGEEAKRYDTALEALRQRHESVGDSSKILIELVFDSYLAESHRTGRWHEEYIRDSSFTLLNQDGDWTPICEIAPPLAGIAPSALLNNGSAKALGLIGLDHPIQNSLTEPRDVGSDGGLMKLLKEYHGQLDESVTTRLWGVFLSMLGPNVRDLADKFTDQRTDTIRDELVGQEKSLPRIRLVQCNYSCEIVSGERVSVLAINGFQFNAPRDTKNSSLLVPHADLSRQGNRHFVFIVADRIPYRVSFKLLDPKALKNLTPHDLRVCIERTIQILQSEVLGVDESRKSEVHVAINKIQKLDQKSLGMAQQEILVSCRMHLTQLAFPVGINSGLAQAIGYLDEADRSEAEARENREVGLGDSGQIENRAKTTKETGIQLLRSVLETNHHLHCGLAAAMRERIKQDGYLPGAIPFELFQNADDALAELPDNSNSPTVFIVEFRAIDARFAHWGRPINHPRISNQNTIRSSTRDLVKMLILHGSDKQVGEENVPSTGKFGLGFKSVYLLTERPELLSKELAFDVVGATFPRRLAEVPRLELAEWLETTMPGIKNGTVIRLPFATPPPPDFENSFRRLSPYLPVFARKVREIRIHGERTISHHWRPEMVYQAVDWSLQRGEIRIEGQVNQLLHLKYRDVSWLFGLDQRGITRIKDIPCLWITAPTMEADDLGFAINGPFEPHPGRTQLNPSGEEMNLRLFRLVSEALEKFLNWSLEIGDQLGTVLRAEAGIDQDSFWRAVWELFSRTDGSSSDKTAKSRILDAVWAPDTGYRRIIESHPVIPNGLPGSLHAMTSAAAIGFETKGFMGYKAGLELLEDAFAWTSSETSSELGITTQEIVSSKVALMLRTRLERDELLASLSLPFFLRRLVGIDSRVTPTLCGKLGRHLNSGGLFPENSQNATYNWPGDEKTAFVNFLSELHFQSLAGSWVKAASLLVSEAPGFEGNRAGFAPPERVLDKHYSTEANAHDFFRLCRGEMNVTGHDLSLWLRESAKGADRSRKSKALLFLASLDPFVADAAGGLEDAEKSNLITSPEFGALSLEDQNRVKNAFEGARLKKAQIEGRRFEVESAQPDFQDNDLDESFGPVTVVTLEDIVREWNLHEALHLFTISGPLREVVIPRAENDEQACETLLDTKSIEGRSAWYRFLCLGCTLSIPRGRRPASDVVQIWNGNLGKDFWEHTIPNSISDLSKDSFKSKLDAFFKNVVDRYYTSETATGEDAEFWRRVFYDFRKMHHFVFHNHLPETIIEFAEFPEADGERLIKFLRSGHIPDDMQDPNTKRFRGVIGQSMKAPLLFIMRELRRLEIIDHQFDEACYYMNSPARRVAFQMDWLTADERVGGDFSEVVDLSRRVHFKMNAELGELASHFDLPLQLYAHKHPR